ncbi:MAG: DUF2339 domain-containing protein [Pseudomonadota bacterium]|nr:DUF2339 domain-containing protein [Pseudomonadota bacterium]
MTTIAFITGLVLVFAALLAFEKLNDPSGSSRGDFGLLAWLASGNWPAKIGAGLLILGVGALIRYFLLNVDLPPDLKLGSGIFSATLFGAISFHLRGRPDRRALHRALAGAALGVTYLTAYSAYGFFGYIGEVEALAFLVLVAAAGGVFSVNSNALSIAVLAMLGAFAAPAFTIGNPGPGAVYGYYLGASAFTFVLVYLRGWRALIHLSFLFTLAGALFFGWTRQFYQPEHFAVLQPLLLALVAIHLAMPLAERHAAPGRWLQRFDQAYFFALPVVAAVLMLLVSPLTRADGALGFAALGTLWALAAGLIARLRIEGAARHGIVALLFFLGAALLYLDNLPWPLFALIAASLLLALAPRLKLSREVEQVLSGAVLVFWIFHALGTLTGHFDADAYLGSVLAPRLFAAAALVIASVAARRSGLFMGNVLGVLALGWTAFVVVGEVARLHLEHLPQLLHFAVITLVLGFAIVAPGKRVALGWIGALAALLVGSAAWAAWSATEEMAWILLLLAPLSLALLAKRLDIVDDEEKTAPMLLAAIIPLVLAPWVLRLGYVGFAGTPFFALTLIVASVFALSLLGIARPWRNPMWRLAQQAYLWGIALAMAGVLLFHIERGLWPVLFELFALATLVAITRYFDNKPQRDVAGVISVSLAILVVQAMLLRAFGPPGVLSMADLARMALPAVVSLMWAAFGGGICWWSTRVASRQLWGMGAVFLVAAAVKLVFFDFGSLGQLGNIIALILAGGVFLGVAWLAPIPARLPPKPGKDEPGDIGSGGGVHMASGWAFSAETPREQPTPGAEPAPEPSVTPSTTAPRSRREPEIPIAWQTQEPAEKKYFFAKTAVLVLLAVLGLSGVHALRRDEVSVKTMPAPSDPAPAPPTPASVPEPSPAEFVSPPAAKPPRVVDACSQFVERLPADYVLLAGGEYGGRKLEFQIDDSGHDATTFDVIVNVPNRPVVLALGAYEPAVWNIRREQHTQIAAVWISGYHRQAIAGLASDVPVLNTSHGDGNSCGSFHVTRGNAKNVDALLRHVLGRSAESYYLASNAKVLIGNDVLPDRLVQDGFTRVDSFRDLNKPPAGQAGLDKLVADGLLRPARQEDAFAWEEAKRQSQGRPRLHIVGGNAELLRVLFRGYVVLGPMAFPAGLNGAHAVSFFVPRGVPRPTGDPGHSAVYDLNLVACSGALCR